jgi:hypothetical protein
MSMRFRVRHELLLSHLPTKDRAVKNIIPIFRALFLLAALSSTLIAQRTSSVVQTVTFGVHRSSLSVLRNLSLIQNPVQSSDSSQSSTLQNVVSNNPIKVTVRAPSVSATIDRSMASLRSSPPSLPSKTPGSGSVPSTLDIQEDVRSSYSGMALFVTITE